MKTADRQTNRHTRRHRDIVTSSLEDRHEHEATQTCSETHKHTYRRTYIPIVTAANLLQSLMEENQRQRERELIRFN